MATFFPLSMISWVYVWEKRREKAIGKRIKTLWQGEGAASNPTYHTFLCGVCSGIVAEESSEFYLRQLVRGCIGGAKMELRFHSFYVDEVVEFAVEHTARYHVIDFF